MDCRTVVLTHRRSFWMNFHQERKSRIVVVAFCCNKKCLSIGACRRSCLCDTRCLDGKQLFEECILRYSDPTTGRHWIRRANRINLSNHLLVNCMLRFNRQAISPERFPSTTAKQSVSHQIEYSRSIFSRMIVTNRLIHCLGCFPIMQMQISFCWNHNMPHPLCNILISDL